MSNFRQGWVPFIEQALRRRFATAAQGALAESALQPADLAGLATSSQGAKADTAVQPHQLTYVQVRQTVSNGPLSWLVAGSGLQVISQNGSAFGTIARGFGAVGRIDDVFEIPNATAWNSLAASATVYLWAEHDGTTLTTGSGTLAPAYGPTAPTSPSSGQWWFDTISYQGFVHNGSAWVAAPRLYVGQATTDGSAVTAVLHYAYNGVYIAPPVAGAINAVNNLTHGIGVPGDFIALRVYLRCVIAVAGYSVGEILPFPPGSNAGWADGSSNDRGIVEVFDGLVDFYSRQGGYPWRIMHKTGATSATDIARQSFDILYQFRRAF